MKIFATLVMAIGLLVALPAVAAVNINTAGAEELEALPGIGAVKAAAIVGYRDSNEGFSSKQELTEVNGIGPATYEAIVDEITLESE